mmetsp:Transcript_50714/g.144944  ORF Transcript_50714/g.144944 Transcript_50714/m.144944 type:complete len:268 (+) Transcript_50714:33-836(+)
MVPQRGYHSRRQLLAKKPQCSSLRQYPVLEVLLERWGEEQEQERARAQSEERLEPHRPPGDAAADHDGLRPRASPRDQGAEGGGGQQAGHQSGGGWPMQGLMLNGPLNAIGLGLRSHLSRPADGGGNLPSSRPPQEAAPIPEQRCAPCPPQVDRGRAPGVSSNLTYEFLHEDRRPLRQTSPAPSASQWSLISFSSLPTEQSVELSEAQDPSERASERMSERDNLDQAPSEPGELTTDDEGSTHTLSRRSRDRPGERDQHLLHLAHRE